VSKLVLAGPGGDTPEAQCGSQDVAPLLSALYTTLIGQANDLVVLLRDEYTTKA